MRIGNLWARTSQLSAERCRDVVLTATGGADSFSERGIVGREDVRKRSLQIAAAT